MPSRFRRPRLVPTLWYIFFICDILNFPPLSTNPVTPPPRFPPKYLAHRIFPPYPIMSVFSFSTLPSSAQIPLLVLCCLPFFFFFPYPPIIYILPIFFHDALGPVFFVFFLDFVRVSSWFFRHPFPPRQTLPHNIAFYDHLLPQTNFRIGCAFRAFSSFPLSFLLCLP